jgi:hypothetical protein
MAPTARWLERGREHLMAIAVEVAFHGQGATLENYFKSLEIMGATPEGRHPDPGGLFHWVTGIGGGFQVTDVWQTREQFEQFVRDQVGPVGEQVGMPQPQIKFVDVANFQTAG